MLTVADYRRVRHRLDRPHAVTLSPATLVRRLRPHDAAQPDIPGLNLPAMLPDCRPWMQALRFVCWLAGHSGHGGYRDTTGRRWITAGARALRQTVLEEATDREAAFGVPPSDKSWLVGVWRGLLAGIPYSVTGRAYQALTETGPDHMSDLAASFVVCSTLTERAGGMLNSQRAALLWRAARLILYRDYDDDETQAINRRRFARWTELTLAALHGLRTDCGSKVCWKEREQEYLTRRDQSWTACNDGPMVFGLLEYCGKACEYWQTASGEFRHTVPADRGGDEQGAGAVRLLAVCSYDHRDCGPCYDNQVARCLLNGRPW